MKEHIKNKDLKPLGKFGKRIEEKTDCINKMFKNCPPFKLGFRLESKKVMVKALILNQKTSDQPMTHSDFRQVLSLLCIYVPYKLGEEEGAGDILEKSRWALLELSYQASE